MVSGTLAAKSRAASGTITAKCPKWTPLRTGTLNKRSDNHTVLTLMKWKSEVPSYSMQSASKRAVPEVSLNGTVPVQNVLDFYAGKENFLTRLGTRSDSALKFYYKGLRHPYTVRMDAFGRIIISKPKENPHDREEQPFNVILTTGVRLV